jgi:hypothetical protein
MNRNSESISAKISAIKNLEKAITCDRRYEGWSLEYFPECGQLHVETVIICKNGHQYSVCVEGDSIVAMIANVCRELLRH